jgi:formamidopyrimidine-DNA glycosylase
LPELPDIELYLSALDRHVRGEVLEKVRLASPFLLRSVEPKVSAMEGRVVVGLRRIGKRIVFEMGDDLFMVFHLMIAGRFRWKESGAKINRRLGLAALDFPKGTLMLTEASKKKRASLYCVRGEAGLEAHDPGGIDVMTASLAAFGAALTEKNHTVKRAMTDPRILSGVGNGYSDEILWEARLSPVKWTSRLDDDEIARLHTITRDVLTKWRDLLIAEVGDGFPDKVTAFRPEMAVHGKYGEPCPRCGDPIQRIRRQDNEVNYCATCQTDGKLLADRSLSRLLKGDWPKTLEELEALKRR